MTEGEIRPQQREIDKQLARARRLGYRKEFQTIPPYIPSGRTPLDEAKHIVKIGQWRERSKTYYQALANLTPEERERRDIEQGFDNLKSIRTISHRISHVLLYRSELLDKMQQHDPDFMNPILTGLKKRPERQAKAERAIQRRGIDPEVDVYGEYVPLWKRIW